MQARSPASGFEYTQLRASGAYVALLLVRAWRNRLGGKHATCALSLCLTEVALDDAILTAVKADDRQPPSLGKVRPPQGQRLCKCAKFIIDGHPYRLKRTRRRMESALRVALRHRLGYYLGELTRSFDRRLCSGRGDCRSNAARVALATKSPEDVAQRIFLPRIHHIVGRNLSGRRLGGKGHHQRLVAREAESALGFKQLMRADAQIQEYLVYLREGEFFEKLRTVSKICLTQIHTASTVGKALVRAGNRSSVAIETDERSRGGESLAEGARMACPAQRAVNHDIVRGYGKSVNDFM